MKKLLIASAILTLFFFTAQAQTSTPPGIGKVITKVSKVLPAGISAVCLEDNILYAGGKGVIYALDVSDPKVPAELGSVNFAGTVRQISAYNGKLFVSARETGLWIFDASSPSSMSLLSHFDSIELATGVDAAGDCMFVGERQTGVEFVDVSDLKAPQHIKVFKTIESQTVFYSNGYLYSGEWAGGKVAIFDARDLSKIRFIKYIDLQGVGDGLWVTGNRLYASTGHHHRNAAPRLQDGDGHGVEIWDVSNPEEPVFISRTEFDIFYKSGIDYWLPRPSGDCRTLFCGDVFNGLYVVDIQNEAQPVILERWKPEDGHAVTSLALADGVAFVAVSGEGLYAMECALASPSRRDRGILPVNPSARYEYATPSSSHFKAWVPDKRGAVKSAVVYGDALFVGAGDAGLYTVKLDRKGRPYTAAHLDIPFAGGVAVLGNHLLVSRGADGLGVYTIGKDLSLSEYALLNEELNPSRATSRYSYWVSVPNDKYVANGARSSGYQFLAVEGTPEAPVFTFRRQYSLNLNYNRYIAEKACPNGLFAYATRSGMVWIDLSDGAGVPEPVVCKNLKNSLTEGVTIFKDGKILLTRNEGHHKRYLCTMEPGASALSEKSGYDKAFNGIPRWEGGDVVLISNFINKSIAKVDVSDFSNPEVLFLETIEAYPEPGLFWKGKAVVPCGYQGLLIEK